MSNSKPAETDATLSEADATRTETDATRTETDATRPGNYFVSNYPPYSFWSPQQLPRVSRSLDTPPRDTTPMGLYVHLPFCRKRCHFCYFKVITQANAAQVSLYVAAVLAEARLMADRALVARRRPQFVYFGGGTPSFLSEGQLETLFDGLQGQWPWDRTDEVTFEAEPGTLSSSKLGVLYRRGVTRLSLGVESFDDQVLEENNRSHHSREILAAYDAARAAGFPQINLDLIAGMVGQSEGSWDESVAAALALGPESITIYQMEVPFNTTLYRTSRDSGQTQLPVAGWATKRARVDRAFRTLEASGYRVASAYTLVRTRTRTRFVYRDSLWRGADLLALGVASFGHVGGVHYQNVHELADYQDRVGRGELPLYRALAPTADESLIREVVLQLKLGHLDLDYFRSKFAVEVPDRFAAPIASLRSEGFLEAGDGLTLTRQGLLQVDSLLPRFFNPEHRTNRAV